MKPADIRRTLLTPNFPVEKLTALLDHDNHQMRSDFRYNKVQKGVLVSIKRPPTAISSNYVDFYIF